MAFEKGHKLFMDKQARSKRKCLQTKKQGKKNLKEVPTCCIFTERTPLMGAGDQGQASRMFFHGSFFPSMEGEMHDLHMDVGWKIMSWLDTTL